MTTLAKFVEMWNGTMPLLNGISDDYFNEIFYHDLRDSMLNVYTEQPPRALSLSQMSKPLAYLIMSKFGIHSLPAVNGKGRWALHYGNVAEATVLALLHSYGVEVDDFQREINIKSYKGHIDFFYPPYKRVVDVKSVHGYYYNSFIAHPNDDRGYLTQVLLYKEAMGAKEASILVVDKNMGGLSEVIVREEDVYLRDGWEVTGADLLNMAYQRMEVLETCELSDVWEKYLPHVAYNPIDSKTKQIPECIRYDSRSYCFYDFDVKSKKVYKQYKAEDVETRVTALIKD